MKYLLKANFVQLRFGIAAVGFAIFLSGCSKSAEHGADAEMAGSSPESAPVAVEHYSMDDFASVDKIDAHVHANTKAPTFFEQAELDNFRLFSINVDYPDFPPIADQLDATTHWLQEFPDRFQFASTFSMDGWQGDDWQANVLEHIDATAAQGAKAVKVWKNIGMDYRDSHGELVMIDDASFDTVISHIQESGLRLIGHQGEPKNCWLPLEEMTVNNDRGYFAAHPQYHMFLHPEFPSYEDQLAARNSMLDKHPGLPFMGAHMASLEWSVDELANFLDRYPDAVADLAARMGQVQYQSGENGEESRQKVRDFFIKYQDRILYASDLTSMVGDDPEEFKASVHKKWLEDWRYLNTEESFTVPEVDHVVVGLALPKSVADKIYRLNSERFFGMNSN